MMHLFTAVDKRCDSCQAFPSGRSDSPRFAGRVIKNDSASETRRFASKNVVFVDLFMIHDG